MAALDALVVATALSTIRRDLGASIESLEWTVNAYTLTFAILLLTGAALGDRFGRRRMFVAGLAVFTAASAACALSPDAASLIAARAVQGIGAALVMPLAMAVLSVAFPREQRARALGIFSGVTGLALIAGPVIGGAIAGGLSWHWIFWINIPLGVILIPLAYMRIPESTGADARLDMIGLVLVVGASLGLVTGLMRANEAGWTSVEVIAEFAIGILFAIAFIAWELRTRMPMVPMRLFGSRAFSAGIAASFLFTAAMYGLVFFLAQFLQIAQAHGPLAAGLRLLPWTATLFVIAPISGGLVNRFGERTLVVAGLGLQTVGMVWIAAIATPDVGCAKLVIPMIIAGAGVSAAMPAAQSAVLNAVAAAEIGKASGTFNMFRQLGAVFGVAIAATVFAAAGGFGSPQAFSAGFAAAIGASAVLSLLATLAALWLPGRRATVMTAAEAKA